MSNILVRTGVVTVLLAIVAFGTGSSSSRMGLGAVSVALFGLLLHHSGIFSCCADWGPLSRESSRRHRGVARVFTLLVPQAARRIAERRKLAPLARRLTQPGGRFPTGSPFSTLTTRIVWLQRFMRGHFGIDAEADVGQPLTYLMASARIRRIPRSRGLLQADAAEERARRPGASRCNSSPTRIAAPSALARHHARHTLETMRRDFVRTSLTSFAHPLTVLVGFLETVRELKLDPERSRDYLNLMASRVVACSGIIDDLLTLSTLGRRQSRRARSASTWRCCCRGSQSEATALSRDVSEHVDAEPGSISGNGIAKSPARSQPGQ